MISVLSLQRPLSGNKLLFALFFSVWSFSILEAQEHFRTYEVKSSETLSTVAKKNKITLEHLVRLNPDLRNGVVKGDVLILPVLSKKVKKNTHTKYRRHIVNAHETFFSIAVIYNTSEARLRSINPSYKAGALEVGDVIQVPKAQGKGNNERNSSENDTYFHHFVQPKETIWRICYKLGISREELFKYNPKVKLGLQIGDTLTLPKSIIDPIENYYFHKVTPTEKLNTIAAYYSISEQTIRELNPSLRYGLRPQTILKIPKQPEDHVEISDISFIPTGQAVYPSSYKKKDTIKYTKTFPDMSSDSLARVAAGTNLTNQDESEKGIVKYTDSTTTTSEMGGPTYLVKQEIEIEKRRPTFSTVLKNKDIRLAFMLPFFLDEYSSEGFGVLQKRSKDFAVHFYNGALMAMEELTDKKDGLSIQAKIYNTEGKNSLRLKELSIARDSFLLKSQAVIGPFYASNAEYIARRLPRIPVISPFSRKHKRVSDLSNLVQRFVLKPSLQGHLLKYLHKNYRGQNIILIGEYGKDDRLMGYIKEQLSAKVPSENIRQLISFGEDGFKPYEYDILANYYKENWYILATKNDVIATDVINGLYNLKDSLVSSVFALHHMEVFDKLELNYLSKVNFHYPTATFIDFDAENVKSFVRTYFRKYGLEPDKYAFLGYDLTYDTILRLASYGSFNASVHTRSRDGIAHRFYYKRYPRGIVYNEGSYLMGYDEDMDAIAE